MNVSERGNGAKVRRSSNKTKPQRSTPEHDHKRRVLDAVRRVEAAGEVADFLHGARWREVDR